MILQASHPYSGYQNGYKNGRPTVIGLICLGLLLSLPASQPAFAKKKKAEIRSAEDLMVVDCLLPQKLRRLGRNNTYLAPRRPIRTTAADCRIRGGEYTEPDQANYATSLKVWLPQAESGDAEAQYFVGQIFEKGLGTTPDYESAATWYLKAAEQDHTSAQIGLGYLYEEGLGVAQDDVKALNWYRRAAGLNEDLVVLQQEDYQELVRAKNLLQEREQEVESLQGEVEELRNQLTEQASETEQEKKRQATLQSILVRLEQDLAARQKEVESGRARIAKLEQSTRSAAAGSASGTTTTTLAALGEIPFGPYYALVIGNSSYQDLPALDHAAVDARQVAELLEKRYGFTVRLMLDANRFEIMSALNDLREELTEKDNLLVYYAGHGERDETGHIAYWQPIDARPNNPANWIANGVVSEHLDLVAAKHVFVVADSVYSGLRTRSSVARLSQGMTEEQRHHHIKRLAGKRARLVMSSGGPSIGSSPKDSRRSNFASAFVEALKSNDSVLEASKLYQQVNERLYESGSGNSNLEFATMKWARNDLSDFFFVPAGH